MLSLTSFIDRFTIRCANRLAKIYSSREGGASITWESLSESIDTLKRLPFFSELQRVDCPDSALERWVVLDFKGHAIANVIIYPEWLGVEIQRV